MLQYKDISCVKWLGFSITFYQFFWSLSPALLEAKNTEMCKPLNESEGKPGLACECGEDPFHSLSYVTKRYSYNMSCIDCPSGYYYESEVFDCRPCPQPNHNCFKHNHARRDCISCDAIEPPSPSPQASTTVALTMSRPTEKPASFSMKSTPTILPTSREPNSRDLFETTSSAPSTTSPLTPKTSEATTNRTENDVKHAQKNTVFATTFGIVVACLCGVVVFAIVLVWRFFRHPPVSPNPDVQRNGAVPHFEMVELPG